MRQARDSQQRALSNHLGRARALPTRQRAARARSGRCHTGGAAVAVPLGPLLALRRSPPMGWKLAQPGADGQHWYQPPALRDELRKSGGKAPALTRPSTGCTPLSYHPTPTAAMGQPAQPAFSHSATRCQDGGGGGSDSEAPRQARPPDGRAQECLGARHDGVKLRAYLEAPHAGGPVPGRFQRPKPLGPPSTAHRRLGRAMWAVPVMMDADQQGGLFWDGTGVLYTDASLNESSRTGLRIMRMARPSEIGE